MLAKALYLRAQPMKWDGTSFNTTFGTTMCNKPIFSQFSHTNVLGNRAKHVILYPGMLPRVFGLEIAHLELSQHPDGMIKNLRYYFLSTYK